MRALALVLTVSACSYTPSTSAQPGDDSPQSDGPGQLDDSALPDGPPDSFVGPTPSVCVTAWLTGTVPTFTPPAFVRGGSTLNTQDDERDPWLSEDELIIYYSRNVNGTDPDVLFATRATTADQFDVPIIKTTLNDDNLEDTKVAMISNELIAFVATRRPNGEGEADIWQATRTTGGTALFETLTQTNMAAVNDGTNQLDPHVSTDGLRLYLAASSPQQISVASRSSTTADFAPPQVIAGIGSVPGDADPTLTADERVIIFSSQRTGLGGTDLWYATRPERDQPFGEVKALPFNTAFNDADPHVSGDGCRIYFSSERAVGNDDFDLFITTLTP